jgi:hypothetical protein
VRSPPASSGGVRPPRRPRPQSACPVLCGQYLTRGNGHLCVSISSWAEEVRLATVQLYSIYKGVPYDCRWYRQVGGRARRMHSRLAEHLADRELTEVPC